VPPGCRDVSQRCTERRDNSVYFWNTLDNGGLCYKRRFGVAWHGIVDSPPVWE
jgi:hypothetical protein